MASEYQTFEDYLGSVHADEYAGTDDDMPDAFASWLVNLDADEFIKYGDQYADLKELNNLPK